MEDQPNVTKPAIAIAVARYVRIPLFCQVTGWTDKAVRRMREEGTWRDGQVFVKRGGVLLIDMEGYYKWVAEGQAAA